MSKFLALPRETVVEVLNFLVANDKNALLYAKVSQAMEVTENTSAPVTTPEITLDTTKEANSQAV